MDIEDLRALASEHGGAPAFRLVEGTDEVAGVVLRVTIDDEQGTLVLFDLGGEDELDTPVRFLVARDDLLAMLNAAG